eukprot:327552_1
MKLVSIAVLRCDKDKAIILCQETDTSGMMLGKNSMREMATFIVREVSSRIEVLCMKSLEYKGYVCHSFKQQNGLCASVLTDDAYPPRAAHGLIRAILKEFESDKKPAEWQKAEDKSVGWNKLPQFLNTYKEPPKDKIEEI